MFYRVKVRDHIRVPPNEFGKPLKDAVIGQIKEKYGGFISKELGLVIDVADLGTIGDGIIIPEDGASYYKSEFELLTFEPEMQEVVMGRIKDIADFGAFVNIGPIDGMMHISQTMNDFVSLTKEKVLQGRETTRVLKIGDKCKARVVAVSYKDVDNPKIGLTMRQQGLGKEEWIEKDFSKEKPKKETKETKK